MTYTSSDDEDHKWPEAMLGPPPWRVRDEDWSPDPMDIAVGKFVREMPLFEIMLMLTRAIVQPSLSWVDVHEAGPAAALRIVQDSLSNFPTRDQFWLELHLGQASRVLDLRQAIMHGIWTEVDPELGVYLSERPVRRNVAKKLTGGVRVPDSEHPTWRREFNAIGVMAGRARARSVSHYLARHQDHWEAHFGRNPRDGEASSSA